MTKDAGSVGCLAAALLLIGSSLLLVSRFDGDRTEMINGIMLVIGAVALPFIAGPFQR